jgi:hypothetical protein
MRMDDDGSGPGPPPVGPEGGGRMGVTGAG